MTAVRTRFAPSPTGYMHIGGMRTALFSWLWARHNQGTFVLRIEDTDQQRNVAEALEPILQAFRWLGLNWDEGPDVGGEYGPYFQSQCGDIYRQVAEKLIAEGKAFRDFDPPELAQADREAAQSAKKNYVNIRRSLDLTDAQVQAHLDQGTPYTVRLLYDRNRTVQFVDGIRGPQQRPLGELPDPVLLRGNGGALYNFAAAVDDARMKITHVIRGIEHLDNTVPQLLLMEAMGCAAPEYAHIPSVTQPGSDKKLSKRDGLTLTSNKEMKFLIDLGQSILSKLNTQLSESLNPVLVSFYETLGFLPAGLLNGLARLGWSLDGETENMSLDFIGRNFSIDRIVKASASFDPRKLMSYQEHWMGQLSLEDRVAGCLPFLIRAGLIPENADAETLAHVRTVVSGMAHRLRIFGDILQTEEFFTADEQLRYDEKNFDKAIRNSDTAREALTKFRARLAALETFDPPSIHQAMNDFVAAEGIGFGKLGQPLRLAATGKTQGIDLDVTLSILGRDRTLARIDRALGML